MSIQENKSELEQIKDTILLWLKHWYYFVISMAICVALAFVYIKTKTPVMEVSAQVMLRQDESLASAPSVSRSQSLLSAFGLGRGSQNIEDETIKMKSQGYIKKIVREYSLNFNYTQSKFLGFIKTNLYDQSPVILSVDDAISDTISPVIFKINVKKDQTEIKMKQGRKTLGEYKVNTLPSVLETPFGTFKISKSEFYDMYKKPMNIDVFCANYDFMTQIYRNSIVVDFEKKSSDLLQLSMDTENPPMAKKILKKIIDTYNEEWKSDKSLVVDKTTEYIDDKLTLVKKDLLQADEAIQNFKNKYNLTDIEADVKYYFTLSGTLQPSLIETESQLKMIEFVVDFIKDENNKYSMLPLSANLDNSAIVEVISNYNEALAIRNEMYKSPAQSSLVREYNAQVEAQREVLMRSMDNAKKVLQFTINDLKKKESEIKNKLGEIPEIESIYIKLRREQELQQTVYIFLLEMQVQTEAKGVSILPKLKIVDEPYVINKPVEPNLIKVAITALFFGGLVLPMSAIYGLPLIKNNKRRKEK